MAYLSQRFAALALFLLAASGSALATECDHNFTSAGNFLTGRTFKAVAEMPRIPADGVFTGVYQYLVEEGWQVQQSDRIAYVISALPAGSRPDRPVPLNVTIAPATQGSTLSLTLSSPGGALTLDNAIEHLFCNILAAANRVPQETQTRAPAIPLLNSTTAAGGVSPMPSRSGERLCVAKACLGMTIEEAMELPLEDDIGSFKTSQNSQCLFCGSTFGLTTNGQRVWFSAAHIDRKWMRNYLQTVKVLCSAPGLGSFAKMKASDGQPIELVFGPALLNGKGILQLQRIYRKVPGPLSESQYQELRKQVSARYGDAAVVPETHLGVRMQGSSVSVSRTGFSLDLPNDMAVGGQMMEQPGCSTRPSLD